MNTYDIIVVGNGVLGLSMALALSLEDKQLKIAVIGKTSPQDGGASRAAGAMLGCFGEITAQTFNSVYGQKKFEMSLEASKLWPDWIKQLNDLTAKGMKKVSINSGTFVILNAKSGKIDSDNYSIMLHALDSYQQKFKKVSNNDIPGLAAVEDSRPMDAVYLPDEGAINSNLLCDNLISILKNREVSFINNHAFELILSGDNIKGVKTDDQQIYYGHDVVLAAGTFSQKLIDKIPALCYRIPRIFSGVGQAVVISPEEKHIKSVIRTPNRSFACGLHVLPRGDNGELYVGATNVISLEPETTSNITYMHFLFKCLLDQINKNFHSAKFVESICGNRPVTVDTFPLIGSTSIKGLWLLSGTYRDGLHLSPYLAGLLAREILNKEKTSHPFSPERRPIQTLSKEEMLQETVAHFIAGGHEHSMQLPHAGWGVFFEDMLYQRFALIYEKLDTDHVLPSEFMIMFDSKQDKYINYFRDYYKNIERSSIEDFTKNSTKCSKLEVDMSLNE